MNLCFTKNYKQIIGYVMRTGQNLQVINTTTQKNFNPDLLDKYSSFVDIGRELSHNDYYKKLNNALPLHPKVSTTNINPNHSLDFNTRVNNYVNALLFKHWEKLLKLINLKRNSFLSDKIYLKLQKPSVTIEHIKSSHSINLDKVLNSNNKTNSTDILIKIPLDKNDYYFEVNLLFNDKILYCDTCNVEIIIDNFLQNSIDKKFKYKIFYHYKY